MTSSTSDLLLVERRDHTMLITIANPPANTWNSDNLNAPWTVGEGWAKRIILCGERIKAERAPQIGLVEEVVESGQSLDRALALAESVGRQSPPAVSACKGLIQHAGAGNIAAAYEAERDAFVGLFDTRDQTEGVNAFLRKRAAHWVNA